MHTPPRFVFSRDLHAFLKKKPKTNRKTKHNNIIQNKIQKLTTLANSKHKKRYKKKCQSQKLNILPLDLSSRIYCLFSLTRNHLGSHFRPHMIIGCGMIQKRKKREGKFPLASHIQFLIALRNKQNPLCQRPSSVNVRASPRICT